MADKTISDPDKFEELADLTKSETPIIGNIFKIKTMMIEGESAYMFLTLVQIKIDYFMNRETKG